MSEGDDKKVRIVTAKVHGDSGVTSVEADVEDTMAENIDAMKDGQILGEQKAPQADTIEAGMRS